MTQAAPYLPGLTPRPQEGAFDHLKEVSVPLQDCGAWRAGLQFFETGYFWEAHELWEAVWMAAPEQSPEKLLIRGMIQRANGRLKAKMGREAAAERLERMAVDLIGEAISRAGGPVMGISTANNAL